MTDGREPEDSSWKLAVRYPLRSFLAALRFLTIIPVSWKSDEDGRFFRASVICFPLIGLLIGSIVALLVFLISPYFNSSLLAVFAILLLSGFSGFLHLDGVADSGDGLLSSRPREQALRIMGCRSGDSVFNALLYDDINANCISCFYCTTTYYCSFFPLVFCETRRSHRRYPGCCM